MGIRELDGQGVMVTVSIGVSTQDFGQQPIRAHSIPRLI